MFWALGNLPKLGALALAYGERSCALHAASTRRARNRDKVRRCLGDLSDGCLVAAANVERFTEDCLAEVERAVNVSPPDVVDADEGLRDGAVDEGRDLSWPTPRV